MAALLLAMPAVLALLSLWSRPALLASAAVLSFLLSFASLVGATLVMLVPAICYASAYYLCPWYPRTLTRSVLAVTLPVWCGIGAFAVAVIGVGPGDPVCWVFTEDAGGDHTYRRIDCQEAGAVDPAVLVDPHPGDASPPASGAASGRGMGGGATSDIITPAESVAGIALLAAGLGAGWMLADPREGSGRPPPSAGAPAGGPPLI